MGEDKERISAEIVRPGAPLLPTANPVADKVEPAKAGLPSFVYVTLVLLFIPMASDPVFLEWRLTDEQCLDLVELKCHSLQQMDSVHSWIP